jgi:predicted component of type VI protein secretion system
MQALAQVVWQLIAVLERIGTRLVPIHRTMSASSKASTDATALRRLPSKVQAELKHEQAQTYGHPSALLKTTLQLDPELATMSVTKFVRSYGPRRFGRTRRHSSRLTAMPTEYRSARPT